MKLPALSFLGHFSSADTLWLVDSHQNILKGTLYQVERFKSLIWALAKACYPGLQEEIHSNMEIPDRELFPDGKEHVIDHRYNAQ